LLAAVLAGLAAGVAFIFVVAFTATSIPDAISVTGLIIAANDLDEVKAFAGNYPGYNATVYSNPVCAACRPPIVEYSYQEGDRYADIRIILDFDREITSKHVRCVNLQDTFDSVEIHGAALTREQIAVLLQDPHCP
jgi:hypothetical protein